MNHVAKNIRSAVSETGAPIRVAPMSVGKDWLQPRDSVGEARTLAEAVRLTRNAGYRIMWAGAEHTLEWRDGEAPCIWICVWP